MTGCAQGGTEQSKAAPRPRPGPPPRGMLLAIWLSCERSPAVHQNAVPLELPEGQPGGTLSPAACEELKKGRRAKAVTKLSNYFRNNEARMDYQNCRRRRLPMGSGAVESGIRRIINLRLKGNGIFWGIHNAEGLIHLRSQLLAGLWSKTIASAILPKEHWEKCAA